MSIIETLVHYRRYNRPQTAKTGTQAKGRKTQERENNEEGRCQKGRESCRNEGRRKERRKGRREKESAAPCSEVEPLEKDPGRGATSAKGS